MSLMPRAKLGSYEILRPIGAGGMGEVYRAMETKLGREVALKVLPAALANDPERMARFQREAQVLASLNHPNIATIYGLEESDGVRALVMELVEGPTLAERITGGPVRAEPAPPRPVPDQSVPSKRERRSQGWEGSDRSSGGILVLRVGDRRRRHRQTHPGSAQL